MKRIIIPALLFIFIFPATLLAEVDPSVKMFMKKADALYKKRTDAKSAEEARSYYEKVLAVDSKNVSAHWKLAKLYYWMGNHASGKDKKMELYDKGIRYAQEGVKLKDDCIPCHFWLGVSYGKFGETKGILQSASLVPYVQDEMKLVVNKDPKFEWGGADRVLGRLFFKLPAIKGGDNKKAIEHLKKSIGYGPKHLMTHRFLAEVYLAEGMKDEAKATLEYIINLPEKEFYKKIAPECREEQDEARKLMKENFGG